jgi:alginate O-acetyltransferase complex protein AlgI
MAFTTPTFLFFFSVCFTLYWLVKGSNLQNALLVAFSYFFYATWDSRFCLLLLAISLIDYCVGLGLARAKSQTFRRSLLALSICSGIGALA